MLTYFTIILVFHKDYNVRQMQVKTLNIHKVIKNIHHILTPLTQLILHVHINLLGYKKANAELETC